MNIIARLQAFGVATAFWPGIAGAATSPRWAIAAIGLYWLSFWPALFALWCFYKLEFDHAIHWAVVCALFSWAWHRDIEISFVKAFAVGVGVSSAVAVFQVFGWSPVYQIVPPAGLFLNKNAMGEAAALVAVICVQHRLWWFLVPVLPALALSTSRGAWLAAGAGLIWNLPLWPRLALVAAVGAGLAGYSGLTTLVQRLSVWHDALTEIRWSGNGSFEHTAFGPYLHNDWLQLLWELGAIGLVPLAVVVTSRHGAFATAVVVLGSFAFPLQLPATAALIAVVAGAGLRQPVADSRVLLRSRVEHSQFV